jgi:hypothetical protein
MSTSILMFCEFLVAIIRAPWKSADTGKITCGMEIKMHSLLFVKFTRIETSCKFTKQATPLLCGHT